MIKVATLMGVMGLVQSQCPTYSYPKHSWSYKDISSSLKFLRVDQNTESKAVWAMLQKEHPKSTGYQITKYDEEAGIWREDSSQPIGAYNIAVDSKGLPALTSLTRPRNIFHK
jgi:hypothetical protein